MNETGPQQDYHAWQKLSASGESSEALATYFGDESSEITEQGASIAEVINGQFSTFNQPPAKRPKTNETPPTSLYTNSPSTQGGIIAQAVATQRNALILAQLHAATQGMPGGDLDAFHTTNERDSNSIMNGRAGMQPKEGGFAEGFTQGFLVGVQYLQHHHRIQQGTAASAAVKQGNEKPSSKLTVEPLVVNDFNHKGAKTIALTRRPYR